MSKETNDGELYDQMKEKRLTMTFSIVTTTLAVIATFGGLGYMIDYFAGTKPLFLIILLVISFPITQILLFKKARQLGKKSK